MPQQPSLAFARPHYIGSPTHDCPDCGGSGESPNPAYLCDNPSCDSGQVPNPHYCLAFDPSIRTDCLPGFD